jgi:histidinol-phosphate aminotransferase
VSWSSSRAFLTRDDSAVSRHAFMVYPLVVQAIGARDRVCRRAATKPTSGRSPERRARHEIVFLANPNSRHVQPLGRSARSWNKSRRVLAVMKPTRFLPITVPALGGSGLTSWSARSRAYGAGLRVGYAVANPDVAEVMNRVRQPWHDHRPARPARLEDHAVAGAANRSRWTRHSPPDSPLGLDYIPSFGNSSPCGWEKRTGSTGASSPRA